MPSAQCPALRTVTAASQAQSPRCHGSGSTLAAQIPRARPRFPSSLNVELWSFETAIPARPSAQTPSRCRTVWSDSLTDFLAGPGRQGFNQTNHGIILGHFLCPLLKPPLSDTLLTNLKSPLDCGTPCADAWMARLAPCGGPVSGFNAVTRGEYDISLGGRRPPWAVPPAPQIAKRPFWPFHLGQILLARLESRPASSSRWGSPLPLPKTAMPLSSMSSWHGFASDPLLPPLALAGHAQAVAATVGAATTAACRVACGEGRLLRFASARHAAAFAVRRKGRSRPSRRGRRGRVRAASRIRG